MRRLIRADHVALRDPFPEKIPEKFPFAAVLKERNCFILKSHDFVLKATLDFVFKRLTVKLAIVFIYEFRASRYPLGCVRMCHGSPFMTPIRGMCQQPSI